MLFLQGIKLSTGVENHVNNLLALPETMSLKPAYSIDDYISHNNVDNLSSTCTLMT